MAGEVPIAGALPEGFVAKTIPTAKYEVFDAKGPKPASVVTTRKNIWALPLARMV